MIGHIIYQLKWKEGWGRWVADFVIQPFCVVGEFADKLRMAKVAHVLSEY